MLATIMQSSAQSAPTSMGCCSRFTDNWRAIPALFVLVTSIMAIILCLVWNQPYLSIAFGIGVICSAHYLYLALQYAYLDGLAESVKKAQIENEKHSRENILFKSSNVNLTSQLEHLKLQNNALDHSVAKLKDQNKVYSEEGNKISTEREKLNESNATLKKELENMNEMQKQLATLIESFQNAITIQGRVTEQIQEATSKQKSEILSTIADNFNSEIKKVKELEASRSQLLGKHMSDAQALVATLQKNVNSYTEMSNWFSNEAVQLRASQLADQQKQLNELSTKTSQANEKAAGLKATIEELSKQKISLDKQVKDMQDLYIQYTQALQDLHTETDLLSKTVTHMDKIFPPTPQQSSTQRHDSILAIIGSSSSSSIDSRPPFVVDSSSSSSSSSSSTTIMETE